MSTPESLPCDAAELKALFLFDKLTDEQVAWLCRNGRVERFEPGYVYREHDLVTSFYVLLEGELVISRRIGEEDVEINRTSRPGAYAGAWRSFFGDLVDQTLDNTLRTTRPSRLYVLAGDKFGPVMRDWFPMPVHLLEGLFRGMKNTREGISQRERLLALGSLAAGLTHELNNPAAAAMRATAALREQFAELRDAAGASVRDRLGPDSWASLLALRRQARTTMTRAPQVSPLEAADREDELIDWFDASDVTDGWRIAATFAQAGLTAGWLDGVAGAVGDRAPLDDVLTWLHRTLETELLMTEIDESTTRISALVTAAQHYSQLDRAPHREIDLHELLDSTLLVLKSRIGDAVVVVKEYDRTLPAIPLYGAEMNQVWTTIIDNALDAMSGHGKLTIRTSRDDDRLLVEICDTGPGVPPEIRSRIFEPFFTTKPVGAGTGLGLDIAWRIVVGKHQGDLSVDSAPGQTRFLVRLPFSPPPRAAPT